MKIFVLLFCILANSLQFVSSTRLSQDVWPTHYTLIIAPDLENSVFSGEVSIYVKTKSPFKKILLNSCGLTISKAFLNRKTASFRYEDNQTLSLSYYEFIPQGEHLLQISYQGKLLERDVGFAKTPFKAEGENGFVFVTNFEPEHAREAFPCFDEPIFKAKFNVKLVSPDATYRGISNMEEVSKYITSKGTVYEFATSVPMSSYLVAFAFTKYPFYEKIFELEGRTISIRVNIFNASEENHNFSVNCAIEALKKLTQYTGISYPLSKLDMIEFNRASSTATENWGLITFKTDLLTPEIIYDKKTIKNVIYHEISHFWFGNLVTNNWWSDLWLQEGFATFMSFKLLYKDDHKQKNHFSNNYNTIFEEAFGEVYENEKKSIPIVYYLDQLENTTKMFNQLVYFKGAAVLEIVEDVIGEDAFREVVRKYLKKFAYKTASTNDFILTIEEVLPKIGVKIRRFIESYVYQSRFPLIFVEKINEIVTLKQHFFSLKSNVDHKEEKWTTPIKYITNLDKEQKLVWFESDMEELTINISRANWILINYDSKGLYKVNYNSDLWKSFAENFSEFNKTEARSLVTEAAFSYSLNFINCDIILDFMKKLNNSSEWGPFQNFHYVLVDNLLCKGFKTEYLTYTDFLKRRFVETQHKTNIEFNETCSIDEKVLKSTFTDSNTDKCAEWINKNLVNNNKV